MEANAGQAPTDQQRDIIDKDATARLLVFGGAGTGKTEVLINRAARLMSDDQPALGGVLLLTFGREIAAELQRRAAAGGGDVAYARAYTFDSFATRLLSLIEPEGDWNAKGYDARIEAATASLTNDDQAKRLIADYRHIIVDEIQDLVGVRAKFVMAVLHCGGGFTLLGDKAQAIYNFQLDDDERQLGQSMLFHRLEEEFQDLETIRLTKSFRAKSSLAKETFALGLKLNAREPDFKTIQRELESIVYRASPASSMLGFLPRQPGTTGLLCYTNVQALKLSDELFEKSVPHEYRRALSDRMIPGWVAAVLDADHSSQITESELERLLQQVPNAPPVDEAWAILRPMSSSSTQTLKADDIADAIRSGEDGGGPPPPRADITVSTVHRAKGLEFDRVVVMKPTFTEQEMYLIAEDTRLLFVALSRARDEICSVAPSDTKGWRGGFEDRWTLMHWRGKKKYARGMELRGTDTRTDVPAGIRDEPVESSAAETQRYIRMHVRPGDPVSLVLNDPVDDPAEIARYKVLHAGTLVGETGDDFAKVLMGSLHIGGNPDFPLEIEGIRVQDVDSVAGTAAEAERAGLGDRRVWNRVRVFGLGRFFYPPFGPEM
jgi:hypothetical protein